MKKLETLLFICFLIVSAQNSAFAQSDETRQIGQPPDFFGLNKQDYII